jgi:SNF2 family DNA or RNA helicase
LLAFQEKGVDFLASRERAYLGDEMRLGKTIQAIVAFNRTGLRSAHVTAPASAVPNWWREINRWADNRSHWSVSSYEKSVVNLPEACVHIADEAHKLKTPEAARTLCLLSLNSPAIRAERFWALSGTPCPNSVWELWSILNAWNVTKLSRLAFLDRYCVWREGDYGPRIFSVKRVPELRVLLEPVFLRRMQRDVLDDLPPVMWGEISLAFSDAGQAPEPLQVDRELLAEEEEQWSRQRRLVGEAKAPVLARFLAEELDLDPVRKIVIFAHHRGVMDILECGLLKYGVARIDGSTRDRGAPVARFHEDPSCRVFLGNDAAKEGIDLSPAADLIFAEMSTVPGDNWQMSMRVQGITQHRPVLIRTASLAGSLDEVITRIHTRKTRALDPVFAAQEAPTDAHPSRRSRDARPADRGGPQGPRPGDVLPPPADHWRLAA